MQKMQALDTISQIPGGILTRLKVQQAPILLLPSDGGAKSWRIYQIGNLVKIESSKFLGGLAQV